MWHGFIGSRPRRTGGSSEHVNTLCLFAGVFTDASGEEFRQRFARIFLTSKYRFRNVKLDVSGERGVTVPTALLFPG